MLRAAAFHWVFVLALVALLGPAAPAQAKLYKYTDKAGNVHIVDSPMKVPPQYHDQLAPEDRPDPRTGERPDTGKPERSLPAFKSIKSQPRAPSRADDADGGEDRRESLRERRRDNCQLQLERLQERLDDVQKRYEKWAAVERKKGKIGDESKWISCSSGDARACIENNRKMRAKREEKLMRSSPYYSEFRTLETKAKQLKRTCRD